MASESYFPPQYLKDEFKERSSSLIKRLKQSGTIVDSNGEYIVGFFVNHFLSKKEKYKHFRYEYISTKTFEPFDILINPGVYSGFRKHKQFIARISTAILHEIHKVAYFTHILHMLYDPNMYNDHVRDVVSKVDKKIIELVKLFFHNHDM